MCNVYSKYFILMSYYEEFEILLLNILIKILNLKLELTFFYLTVCQNRLSKLITGGTVKKVNI